ncbi:Zinc metallo ase nas-6 [Brachionus plicatilis]|uniref:Metalloendopeptidase n=1 Tax=Brachionus plicatilis TaxID=10195 RepID=A0A3M7T8L8_BRAPC|nr:Zinc metallo ase nas-6 [Brachionus plicatilis]
MKIQLVSLILILRFWCIKSRNIDLEFDLREKLNNEDIFEGDILFYKSEFQNGAAINDKKMLWQNGLVPYEFSSEFSASDIKIFMDAFEYLENSVRVSSKKCITMIPRTNQFNYVKFVNGNGCYSFIGKVNKSPQIISLNRNGCLHKETIVHEVLHALGFYHEQSRPDRDNYIKINIENIHNGQVENFAKYGTDRIDLLNEPFDYYSIMIYGPKAFSKNGKPTITALNPKIKLNDFNLLSDTDIREIRKLYQCIEKGKEKVIEKKTRLYNDYAVSFESNEIDCFEKCDQDLKCWASTFDFSNSYVNMNCFLFDKNYTVTYEESWISYFKEDEELKVTLFDGKNHNGLSVDIVPIDGICREVPQYFWDKASSIKLNLNCIILFSREDCTSGGTPIRFSSSKSMIDPSNFGESWFDNQARSFTSCQGYSITKISDSLDSNSKGNVYWHRINGGDFQIWEFEPLQNGLFKIRNRATSRYLTTIKENEIFTDSYKLESSQQWTIQAQKIINREHKTIIEFEKLEKEKRKKNNISKSTRLYNHYTVSFESNETDCFETCDQDSKCWASTFDFSNSYVNMNCFLFDKNYTVTYEESWISYFKN